jgi:predicted naringenin-chalcone synthase
MDKNAQIKAEEQFDKQKRAQSTFVDFMKMMSRKTVASQKTQSETLDDKTIVQALYIMSQEHSVQDMNIIIFRTFLSLRDRINELEYTQTELNKKLKQAEAALNNVSNKEVK